MRSLAFVLLLAACGSDHKPRTPGSCDGPCPQSKIDHLVIVIQENHTFDNYFGTYCTAPSGSAPTCTSGPGCCEAGPATDPSGASPVVLDDNQNGTRDPDHTEGCETQEMDGGAMDKYVTGVTGCSNAGNFAYAGDAAKPYRDLASGGGLADRYFQPLVGQSSANDMYFARAQFVFSDNDVKPNAVDSSCSLAPNAMSFTGPVIGDILDQAGVSWSYYVEGYGDAVKSQPDCPRPNPDCPFGVSLYPCVFDPSDIPIEYYDNLKDDPRVMRDVTKLASDLDADTLPQVAYVRGLGYHSEHPGEGTTISDGATFVTGIEELIAASDYAPDTLVLVTWDEGGGYFDHIAPPPDGSDGKPYGTRIPLIATGPFVAPGTISHATMEHSSLVSFIEWNWTSTTGQLGGRDANVANLGSLLDPSKTGVTVPQ